MIINPNSNFAKYFLGFSCISYYDRPNSVCSLIRYVLTYWALFLAFSCSIVLCLIGLVEWIIMALQYVGLIPGSLFDKFMKVEKLPTNTFSDIILGTGFAIGFALIVFASIAVLYLIIMFMIKNLKLDNIREVWHSISNKSCSTVTYTTDDNK